jgi:hypothetical protein
MEPEKDWMEDFFFTDDRSMVKVETPGSSDPPQWLGVESAIQVELEGRGRIMRKSDSENYETLPDGRIIVDILDKKIMDSYGTSQMAFGIAMAEEGEKAGKWRIVRKKALAYETQVMTPEAKPFKALGMSDVYGEGTGKKPETKGVKKKSVAWIGDAFMRGGAEISSELVISVGRDCGFDIQPLDHKIDPALLARALDACDLAVINNIFGFSAEHMRAVLDAISAKGKPYVKYEHDHRELDRPEFSKRLFSGSKLNVFLSPMHLANHKKKLGCDGIALPLAIDIDFFKPVPGVVRIPGSALVCNVRNFKSWKKLQSEINKNKELDFSVISPNDSIPVSGKNVKWIPPVAYEQMPQLYSRFEYLFHVLDGLGAGERVVWEAALCGCKVVANDKVGHVSWDREFVGSPENREWLRQAPYDFWKAVSDKVWGNA